MHLLFLLLFNSLSQLLVFTASPASALAEPPPLSFEFVEVPDPESEETPPESTPLLSDRHSTAQDELALDTDSAIPASEGLSERSRDRETAPMRPREVDAGEAGQQRADYTELLSQLESTQTASKSARESIYGTPALPPPSVRAKNQASSAKELGSFRLSTYEWDFAPYMRYLKRLIEGNISPPPAFSHYGLIEGKTWVRFRIRKDGKLTDLEVVRHEGNEGSNLLSDTSVRAVVNSADFRSLPDHFPDEYLEISGLFEYIVYRMQR